MIQKLKDIMAGKSNEEEVVATTENPTKEKKSSKKSNKAKAELEELKIELAEQKDKFLRLFAEFDNFKKRTVKERMDLLRTASSDTIQSLLPIMDDFDRAKKAAEDGQEGESFSEGVQMIFNKLQSTLKAKGLEEMVSTGEEFDPELHQALTEIPAPTEDMKGKVVDTIEKGYLLKEKIIRHAKVVVGK